MTLTESDNMSISSLYDLATTVVLQKIVPNTTSSEIYALPDRIIHDLIHKAILDRETFSLDSSYAKLRVLFDRLTPLVWSRLLKYDKYWETLFKYYQRLSDFERLESIRDVPKVDEVMITSFQKLIFGDFDSALHEDTLIKHIQCGLILGSFFSESSWYKVSEGILTYTKALSDILPENKESRHLIRLECYQRLFHTMTMFSKFDAAEILMKQIKVLMMALKIAGVQVNYALLFVEFSRYYFSKNNYEETFKWAHESMLQLHDKLPVPTTIQVLRQASKACTVKQDFAKAKYLIHQALARAYQYYGSESYKLAGLLADFGFYLLNSDQIEQSVNVYEKVFSMRINMFSTNYYSVYNLLIAIAQEDLAYALYVQEYGSGLFRMAMKHVKEAIEILKKLFPEGNLMLASANRVKALILEEIALDRMEGSSKDAQHMFEEAELLHKDALKLIKDTFGEQNILTAKHYGNLGRLYQSMGRYSESEKMHLKALNIKESIFGLKSYEVGLSVGQLASLYNYHMCNFEEAEELYFRSININLKLFSKAYSGLEYDYRGLMHVYQNLDNEELYLEFLNKLSEWNSLRSKLNTKNIKFNFRDTAIEPLDTILQTYQKRDIAINGDDESS